jgi:hypothetical protein
MTKWKPDLKFLTDLEASWRKSGSLDKQVASMIGETVEDAIKACADDLPNLVAYLKTTFPPTQVLSTHPITGREAIAAMRKGTAYGVVYYSILYSHKDCCTGDPTND